MRHPVILMGTVLSLVLVSACDRGADTSAGNVATVEDTNELAGALPADNATDPTAAAAATPTDTAGYTVAAALGDMYEIESSKLAQDKAQSDEIKRFAAQMIEDHTASTRQVKDAIAKAGLELTPPSALDPARQAMIDALKASDGAAFDTLYREQQLKAHEEALTLHQNYAAVGDTPDLKVAAGTIAPKVQAHLDMLRAMRP